MQAAKVEHRVQRLQRFRAFCFQSRLSFLGFDSKGEKFFCNSKKKKPWNSTELSHSGGQCDVTQFRMIKMKWHLLDQLLELSFLRKGQQTVTKARQGSEVHREPVSRSYGPP